MAKVHPVLTMYKW